MAGGYEELVAEIDRVVNSPYPTQLKSLRDLLCLKCASADVLRWAQAMPCQIDRLASDVLDGLRQWPYVLDVVERLCSEVKIRDAFLRQEPTLLRDIVVQAARSANAHSRYTSTAAVMLSHPLPRDVSLPSEVQTVFVRAFEQAADEPSVQSIKPIYHMLQGTSTILLGLLSSTVLLRFEEQLFSILRNVRGDNHSLCLYCLAIMRLLSGASDEHMASLSHSYDTQELLASTHVTPSRWTPDAIMQFFSGTKAQKTMQLVVLRAMWACTTTTGEALDERAESVQLANEIIAGVPEVVRETWRRANALVARKLEEKVLAPALETTLQFQSICFLLRLTQGHVNPATALDRLRQVLTKETSGSASLCHVSADDICYMSRCGVFDQGTTRTFLQNVVDFATSTSLQSTVERNASLKRLLHAFSEAMIEHEDIIEGTMLAMDVLSCGQKLQDLARLPKSSDALPASRTQICHRAAHIATNELIHAICKVFLRAALSSRQSTYSVSHETMSLVLDMHASSSQKPDMCSHVRRRQTQERMEISFPESTSTPEISVSNWREALQMHLLSRIELERASLTAIFAKSCAELEERCENFEQPLREQNEKYEILQGRYDDLSEAYSKLESEGIDRNIQYNAMEMESDQYLGDLETAREESGALAQKINELEAQLRQMQTDAEESATKLRKEMEIAELEHAAALAAKEEHLDELQDKVATSNEELECKNDQLESTEEQLRDAQLATAGLNSELEALRSSNHELQVSHDQLRDEKSDLLERIEERETQLQRSKVDADAAQQTHGQKISQLQKNAQDDRAALLASNEQAVDAMTKQHEQAKADLVTQIDELREERRQKEEAHAAETKHLQQGLLTKQTKIDKLLNRCEQKDKQIAEANAMRCNLMAAMGLNGSMSKQTKLTLRPLASFDSQQESQDFDTQTDPSPPAPLSGNDDESQPLGAVDSFASNASSNDSKSGPTPKRARPRRSIKVASPAKPRISGTVATRSTRKSTANSTSAKRQPLSSVSANQGQRRDASSKTASKAMVHEMDESTFDGSELFTGTQGQGGMDLGEDYQGRL